MKKAMATMLAVALLAGFAMAADEKIQDKDYVFEGTSRIQITGTLDSSSPTWNRAFGSGAPSLDCIFGLSDSGADGQYFDQFCITSTDDNPIEIVVDGNATTISDTTLHIYCDTFDPNAPLDNCVYYDDDGGDGLYSAITAADNVVLPAGTEYWLILSTFSGGDMGDFVMDTSDNVALCGSVANEPTDWSSIKSLFR